MNQTTNYRCERHDLALRFVLKGGAGWCGECRAYVQAAGVPMPELDPHIKAKREAAQQPQPVKAKRAKSAQSKKRRRRKSSRRRTKPATITKGDQL